MSRGRPDGIGPGRTANSHPTGDENSRCERACTAQMVVGSAHCRSSSEISSGVSRERNSSSSANSSPGQNRWSPGRSRALRRCRSRTGRSPLLSADSSGANGAMASISSARPAASSIPASRPSWPASARNLLLPIPGQPSTRTTPPQPPWRPFMRATTTPSSASRPRSGNAIMALTMPQAANNTRPCRLPGPWDHPVATCLVRSRALEPVGAIFLPSPNGCQPAARGHYFSKTCARSTLESRPGAQTTVAPPEMATEPPNTLPRKMPEPSAQPCQTGSGTPLWTSVGVVMVPGRRAGSLSIMAYTSAPSTVSFSSRRPMRRSRGWR